MTPSELFTYTEGFSRRAEFDAVNAHNNAVITAYLTSRFVWQKKVKVDKFLAKSDGHAQKTEIIETDQQMEDFMRLFAAKTGGVFKKG